MIFVTSNHYMQAPEVSLISLFRRVDKLECRVCTWNCMANQETDTSFRKPPKLSSQLSLICFPIHNCNWYDTSKQELFCSRQYPALENLLDWTNAEFQLFKIWFQPHSTKSVCVNLFQRLVINIDNSIDDNYKLSWSLRRVHYHHD